MKAESQGPLARRVGAALLFAGVFLALAPGQAQAHALLVSTVPVAGSRLGTAPGVVVLRFSEPLTPKLSFATVKDPLGNSFTGQATGTEISVFLVTNAPGPYRVTWKSVSADDGHTEQGSFGFTVIAPPAPGSSGAVSGSPGSPVALGVFRTVQYVALLLAVGILLITRLARRKPEIPWVRIRRLLPWDLAAALLASIVVVSTEAAAASSLSLHGLAEYLTTGVPGTARIVLLGAGTVALLTSLTSVAVWPFLSASLVALAASGHGASARPLWWGVTVDAGHLLTAGLWAGGIMTLAVLRPPGGFKGAEGRRLLDRFSPVALTAFLGTVGFGIIQAFQDVGTLHALVGTTYGRVLVVKVGLVGVMIPLSVLAWRRLLAPRAEGMLAVFVVGAAALLAAYPLPARQIAPARADAQLAPASASSSAGVQVTSSLPAPGDLTLGDHAGQILVGLTLRPAKPGPNQLLVYLLPLQGSAKEIPVKVSVDGKQTPVQVCGSDCRVSQVILQGGERVTVTADVSIGGSATFDLPKLPAPDGTALLEKALHRMHALTTYRLDEVLSSGLASIHSEYAAQAPDRLDIKVGGESETILIGGTRYLRNAPNAQWQVESGGPPVPEPSFIWDYFKPFVDPKIVGKATVDNVPTTIVAFAGGAQQGLAIWLRLWIDSKGLVRQAHMRAIGHFMDHRYFDFDAPTNIVPPVGPGIP